MRYSVIYFKWFLTRILVVIILSIVAILAVNYQSMGQNVSEINRIDTITNVYITIPAHPDHISPLIYGEMLEVCNDSIIYGGIVNKNGTERRQVDSLIKLLNIPVIRWPGGTYSLEYHWRNGIGPLNERPFIKNHAWGGYDNNRFGTNEFLNWCGEMGIRAYINLNMGSRWGLGGTLQEALNWIEYVNGTIVTSFGKMRADNGHKKPYNVNYWGIGNENYYYDSLTTYSNKLYKWAGAIHLKYPKLRLLAVGHTYAWDSLILEKNGSFINFITQHYYITSKLKDNKILDPENSLFAPVKMEAHIMKIKKIINHINQEMKRINNPIKISIDEWDNRHSVYNGTDYRFTRQDPRRQFDAAIVAEVLNVFIRQSPAVGMANYLFPVNGHGLIKSQSDTSAYASSIYYVFKKYRHSMIGGRLNVEVEGPGISGSDVKFALEGDANKIKLADKHLNFIDVSAVIINNHTINIALVNRCSWRSETVKVHLPKGYSPKNEWIEENNDINMANTARHPNKIIPQIVKLNIGSGDLTVKIPPCGINIIHCTLK